MVVFLRVYLVRHGQSSNNVLAATSATSYNTKRTADAVLTELGRRQAEATGLFFASTKDSQNVPLKQIYSSAMARALATASHIAQPLGLRPRCYPDICEVGGIFEHFHSEDGTVIGTKGVTGMSRAQVEAAFPMVALPADESITEKGWWQHAEKETEEEGVERVRRVLRELVAAALALQSFDGTNEKDLEDGFDVRAHLRRRKAAPAVPEKERGGDGAPEEGFDSPGSVDEAARRFHSKEKEKEAKEKENAAAAVDTRQSGGDTRAALKYTKDGRPKLSGTRGARVGLDDASADDGGSPVPGPRSIAVALVCHGDFIETALRLIATLDAETAREMAQKHENAGAGASAHEREGTATSSSLLHNNPLAAAQFCHHNASISAFDVFPDGNIRLLRVNDASHLLYHKSFLPQPLSRAGEEASAPAPAPSAPSFFFSTELLTGGPGV